MVSCTVCHDDDPFLCIDKNKAFQIILAYIYVYQHPFSTISQTLIIYTTVVSDKSCICGKLISDLGFQLSLMAVNRCSYLNTFYNIYLCFVWLRHLTFILSLNLHSVVKPKPSSGEQKTDLEDSYTLVLKDK